MTQSKPVVLVCGNVFEGVSERLSGSGEILVQDGKIAEVAEELNRPPDADVVDLSERTVMPGSIDTHVHLTIDASGLTQQTLQSLAAKALKGLNLAQECMSYGFTTLRDLGSMDPQFPTVDLRNALKAGLVNGLRLVVAVATRDLTIIYRAVLIATLLLLTTPISAHAITKAAYQRGEAIQASDPTDESGRNLPGP